MSHQLLYPTCSYYILCSQIFLEYSFSTYGARRSYERAIVLLEGMTQEYNAYIDQMVNNYDSMNVEFDEQGLNEAQNEVNAINEYLSKLYYGYGTILSEFEPSDCLHLMTEEESLLIDIENGIDEKSAKVVCTSNAINALRMAVDLNDENIVAHHMLNSMTNEEALDENGGLYRGKLIQLLKRLSILFLNSS